MYFYHKKLTTIHFGGHLNITAWSILWIIYLESTWHLSTFQFILTQELKYYQKFQIDIN